VLTRLVKFAGASGLGVCLDYLVYGVLAGSGVTPALAYVAGATTGLTFVFALSLRHVFEATDRFRWGMFWTYAAYQAVSVAAGAGAVEELTHAFDGRYLLAKLCVLPVTFATNYLFMAWLVGERTLPTRQVDRGLG
jgi:putative flippase GtrA